MIIITGAAGFIGSCWVAKLNEEGYRELVLVDDFSRVSKRPNFDKKQYTSLVEREEFFDWVTGKEEEIQFIFHLGARTDTSETDRDVFEKLNVSYSQKLWDLCVKFAIPFVYASSAATYGSGEEGFDDRSDANLLRPLNPYGQSKQDFDLWALAQDRKPFFWAGLKFFNVYGPNEYHKGRMASVIFHAFHQIQKTGKMKLFRSHNPNYADGEQLRDFIYVKDLCEILYFFMLNRKHSGIYNVGTGKARTFWDLVTHVFLAMGKEPDISFIDTPIDIRDNYQYFTEAKMAKLRLAGYDRPFKTLEEGTKEYVQDFLMENTYW